MRTARAAAVVAAAVGGAVGLIFYESLANASIVKSLVQGGGAHERPRSQDASIAAMSRSVHLCHPNGTPVASSVAAVAAGAAAAAPVVPATRPNDQTIEWSPCVYRPWVFDHHPNRSASSSSPESSARRSSTTWGRPWRNKVLPASPSAPPRQRPPPFKVLLTNFGWNHPDQSIGRNVTRSIRSTEFVTGIVNHPYFDPTDWDDVQNQVVSGALDPASSAAGNTRYYVFLDVETCYESNYPVYGGGHENNLDAAGGRVARKDRTDFNCLAAPRCPAIPRVLSSALFRSYPNHTRLVYFDCRGNSMPWKERQKLVSRQFAIASYSAGIDQHDRRVDQGLAAPAVTKIELAADEVRDIDSCNAETNRTFLFTFVGSCRNAVRHELIQLHDPERGVISLPLMRYRQEYATGVTNVTFPDLLRGSLFAGAPIGDNRFSYRFTEVLSAGAIPVVHSDGWVLPFRPELVDWTGCLLHLPEASVPNTIEILRNVTAEQRCRMRKRCMEIYRRYMADGEGTIRGILDGLELVAAAHQP